MNVLSTSSLSKGRIRESLLLFLKIKNPLLHGILRGRPKSEVKRKVVSHTPAKKVKKKKTHLDDQSMNFDGLDLTWW